MKQQAAGKLMVAVLSLNAALLLLVAILLLARGEWMPQAMAQSAALPQATQDVIVAPAQLASNVWGCYVMDVRAQTLCVYQYAPGEKMLKLQAARGIEHDLHLKSFNTSPLPGEVAKLVEREQMLQSGLPATAPAPETEKNLTPVGPSGLE